MTYIHVKVQPGARREELKKVKAEHFAVSVREPAERNLANGRVRELLALEYNVRLADVRLVSGHQSSGKIFDIRLKVK